MRILLIFLWLASNIQAQRIPFSGSSQTQNSSGQQQSGGNTQGGSQQGGSQQGGSVSALTATTINNGYTQGSQVQVSGTSVRLNLRSLFQQRQQVTTYRQHRLNLRLGGHGFIQLNNSSSGNSGGSTTQGGGTTQGGSTTQGGGTTQGGSTTQGGGTTQGGSTTRW